MSTIINRKNVLYNNLYFYIFEGQMFWGRHHHLPPSHWGFDVVFRTKPLIPNRWYFSGGFWFIATGPVKDGGEWCVLIHEEADLSNVFKPLLVSPRVLYGYRNGTSWIMQNKHESERLDFKNAFRKRLLEFTGCSFMTPFSKRRQRPCR